LVVYSAISMMRQDGNPAMFGCFLVSAISQFVIESAATNATTVLTRLAPWSQLGHWSLTIMLLSWSGLAALAGWYTAGFFHKLDE
ncbi:MAG TPA: hypothetical protein VGS41_04655, partial [Chthonomonadales bacterium]|nr:hypothetical protein [Chthonomonadales bacterium]